MSMATLTSRPTSGRVDSTQLKRVSDPSKFVIVELFEKVIGMRSIRVLAESSDSKGTRGRIQARRCDG